MPVEVKAREFESRLLLSSFAADHGYGVIIGEQNKLVRELPHLPRGIYFDKSIAKNKYTRFKRLLEMGFILAGNDEEGLASRYNRAVYLNQRLSDKTLGIVKAFFTWGREEFDIITDHYKVDENKLLVSGNPRVDLWRPEFRGIFSKTVRQYQSRYGKYILLPTNFTSNHAKGVEFVIKQAKKFGTFTSLGAEKKFRALLEYDERIKKAFIAALPRIRSALPEHRIIIRPHPAEDHNFWKKISLQYPSTDTIFEGTITPWILGSDMVIHSSCTTGLEAYLLDVPVVSYLPFTDNPYIEHISNVVSRVVHSEEDLQKLVRKIIDENLDMQPQTDGRLRYSISSLSGPFASEKILDGLHKIAVPADTFNYKPSFDIKWLLIAKLKKICYGIGLFHNYINYGKQKFPGTSIGEVKSVIARLHQVSGKFNNIRVSQINENLFHIFKATP